MQQFDDYETSTRVCACGARFTWAGWSDDLDAWMREHAPHCNQFTSTVTVDGKRAGEPAPDWDAPSGPRPVNGKDW